MAVDLHTHTTHSDGTYTPEKLVGLAQEKRLTAIAITDHDITTANEEAIFYGRKLGVEVVPGVELSIEYDLPGNGHLHILGLFIDDKNAELNSTLSYLRNERSKRNDKILSRLDDLGKSVSHEDVLQESGDGSIGRPHVARALMKNGHVSSIREAFQIYLKKGALAYIPKVKLGAVEAIDLIHEANGLSIIAHPISLGYSTYEEIGEEIKYLMTIGLDGIEVYSSNHSEILTKWLSSFATSNGLAVSGGSDFHGEIKPEILLGDGAGNLNISDQVYSELVKLNNDISK